MVYLETALLDGFRFHLDRTAGAFAGADAAALAVVVIEDVGDVVVTGLNHGVVRAHTVAVVALQAVAAYHAKFQHFQSSFCSDFQFHRHLAL